jgi:acetyl-CoA carboxylase carboxyltransferase component
MNLEEKFRELEQKNQQAGFAGGSKRMAHKAGKMTARERLESS